MTAESSHEQQIPKLITDDVELFLVNGEKPEVSPQILKRDVPMLGALVARKFEPTYKPMSAEDRDIARRDARASSVRLLFKTYGLIESGTKSDGEFDAKYKVAEESDSMQDRSHILELSDQYEHDPTQVVFDFMMGQTKDKALLQNIVTMRRASLLLLEENSAG